MYSQSDTKINLATHEVPMLFVDLDGTLVATDTLWESLLAFMRSYPHKLFLLVFWLIKGKAHLKNMLAQQAPIDISKLPYRQKVLAYVEEAKKKGQDVVLATGAHQNIAERVSNHIGIFSGILATQNGTNLIGKRKLAAILEQVQGGQFGYVGDSEADLPILKAAKQPVLVNPSKSLMKKARNGSPIEMIEDRTQQNNRLITWFHAVRAYQWSKNLLLFIPLLMAHKFTDLSLLGKAVAAFWAFSFSASAVYIVNDLFDLEADRAHASKRNRPFAAGKISIPHGIAMVLALLASSALITALFLPGMFYGALLIYIVATTAYSGFLKKKIIIDVMMLGFFYTFRVIIGAVAIIVPISSWLLAFSSFFFMSLGFIKRYADLIQLEENGGMRGRGYIAIDQSLVFTAGIATGYLSLLVFAFYIHSDHVRELYQAPQILWLIIPCLFYWLTRLWMVTRRGEMTSDPVVYALKDRRFYIMTIVVVLSFIAAKLLHIDTNSIFGLIQ